MDHHRTSSGARPNLPNLDVVPDFIAANLSSCVRFVSPERSPPWPPARPLLKPTGGGGGSNLKKPRILTLRGQRRLPRVLSRAVELRSRARKFPVTKTTPRNLKWPNATRET